MTAKTKFNNSKSLFEKNPDLIFPPFDLQNHKIISFHRFNDSNSLSQVILQDSIASIEISDFIKKESNKNIIKIIINRWIKKRCKKVHLNFDDRTKTYYYPRSIYGEGIVNSKWKPKSRWSNRELTKPMKRDGKVNFWVHRATSISCVEFCGDFYIQIRPRFLFSSNGFNLFEGTKASRLDRYFRKSKFNRNLNQLYDVRFWSLHVFPEIKNPRVVPLTKYLGFDPREPIKILEQVCIESKWKPNTEITQDIEELDKIDSDLVESTKIDHYFEEEEI